MCIHECIQERSRIAVNILDVAKRLVTLAALHDTEEHILGNDHTNAKIPVAKRHSLVVRH